MASLLETAARDFLAQRRLAVVGVSRAGDVAANGIYRKLRAAGYTVFPVNPHADTVEGDRCYPTLAALPGSIDGVVIATAPAVTAQIVEDCAALGIRRVWIQQGIGPGSVTPAAVERAAALGLSVIPGSCPMQFCAPVDGGHRCIRWLARVRGREPVPLNPV